MNSITANLVDVIAGTIQPAKLTVRDGKIAKIDPISESKTTNGTPKKINNYLIPGFVDSHIHIESSMLLPSQFARAAVLHGTVATVSDPHEIANVCGREGIELFLRDGDNTIFKFHFGAPACVPATPFETSGAELDVAAVTALLDDPRIGYLSEMMNFPGVLHRDPDVMAKISAALARNKPVDGHAPGLRGEEAAKYIAAGISTDHECTTREEAVDKLAVGCKIAIREGSAARNFDALESLIDDYPDEVMFCSDDKHPDELLEGHINQLAARAIANGRDVMSVLKACSVNAVKHYGLDVGLLQIGDPADFVLVKDLVDFEVLETFIDGECVAKDGQCLIEPTESETINQFSAQPIQPFELAVVAPKDTFAANVRVIEVIDGQLITRSATATTKLVDGKAIADPESDLLKLVVVNRYEPAKPAIAFVRGFEMRDGAIASSVAHDSHNILAVGTSDEEIAAAINAVIEVRGGLAVAINDVAQVLSLPIAGLISPEDCETVGDQYGLLDRTAKELGCKLRAPFMTLSFLALPVIPSLKLTDKGLFDVDRFEFVDLFV